MDHLSSSQSIPSPPPWEGLKLEAPAAIALGLFDGVHLGHQEILRRTCQSAERLQLVPAVFTFSNHPRAVLNSTHSQPPLFLIPLERRIRLLKACGIREILAPPFSQEWASTRSEAFAHDFLSGHLGVRHVVVGFNYCFGRRAEGRVQHLQDFGRRFGFTVEVVPPYLVEDEEVSSTRTRKALLDGNISLAARLLGRPPEISGEIVQGDQRGRLLGFPTANIRPVLPPLVPEGVYAVQAWDDSSEEPEALGPGLLFFGTRKTFFENEEPVLEAHLLDFQGDLYGMRVRLELLGKIRDPRKFENAEALIRQIEQDRADAQAFFSKA